MAYLKHYGTPRHSGRYPWGSSGWGEGPPYHSEQRNTSWLGTVKKLRSQGLTDKEIYEGMKMNSSQFRNRISLENAAERAERKAQVDRLADKGWSNSEIGRRMGLAESSVRSLRDATLHERSQVIFTISNMLEDQIKEKGMIDVGDSVAATIGITPTKLKAALSNLKHNKGYTIEVIQQEQMGMPGKFTHIKVLAAPGTTMKEISKNREKIQMISGYSEDSGRSFLGIEPPKSVSSKEIQIVYAEDGGKDMDGVIELRRGINDLSLGNARYAQVRIAVDDTHYLKGMAVYSDDLPKGVNIRFNTNKTSDTPMIGPKDNTVLKPMERNKETGEVDMDNPFGATIRQRYYKDSKGDKKLSAINIVGSKTFDENGEEIDAGFGEEGAWGRWSKTLSSQMLSKQSTTLAQTQLTKAYESRKKELEEIVNLTNPVVKKKMLSEFAESADSDAVHLKAAGLPNQAYHVILPMPKIKETEIYSPNYNNGEKVVLIRHPHGGIFEIPELTVNNRTPAAQGILGKNPDRPLADAVGIHPKVADQLSGADFDGDTVIVIPNPQSGPSRIKVAAAKETLINFDPKEEFKGYEGMKVMGSVAKQQEMGKISNLITDMTIRSAPLDEIIRAVKHSMVVIDAEKHALDYKRSEREFRIPELKKKYQGGPRAGAATLISKASAKEYVNLRNNYIVDEHGKRRYIDEEGRRLYSESGKTRSKKITDPKTGEVRYVQVIRQEKVPRMSLTNDATTLSSGTEMETIYATYANNMKQLANTSRKMAYEITPPRQNTSAKITYAAEVSSLKAKLNDSLKNKEKERNAQLLAGNVLKVKRQANPGMEPKEIKKIRNQSIAEMRSRTGAQRNPVVITPKEWEAIQAGAVSATTLTQILNNTDMEKVKRYATPRDKPTISEAQLSRAKAMLAAGNTQAEVAAQLGIPRTTLMDNINAQ